MHVLTFVSSVLIAAGAAVMALNIKKGYEVMLQLKSISSDLHLSLRRILVVNQILVIVFFIGYIAVFMAIQITELTIGNLFVSFIFFTGAVFVTLGIVLQKSIIRALKETYQDVFSSNHELSENQEKLARTNAALGNEIEKQQETRLRLSKSLDTQTVVNKILKVAMSESSIPEIIDSSLDLVLSLPWLSFESQGSIFLVDERGEALVLKAHRGFSPPLQEKCGRVAFGKCLCGMAAQSQDTVFASNIDDRHEILLPDTEDHGHYCIPITAKGKVLGVINVHIPPGHEKNIIEVEFLNAVANTLALVLMQRYGEERNEKMRVKSLQSQKMEAMGTLAGGIAHDFNNILSGIFGYVNLAASNIESPEKAKQQIQQIYNGARRAADLVQQILTFTRQTGNRKTPIKPILIIKEAVKLLRSSIPVTIEIRENLVSRSMVLADPTHIHQIVMNLCTNAFHAMQTQGGVLYISLEDMILEDMSGFSKNDLSPGKYIRLEVSDTGCGMTPALLEKIFEPYFTTKEMGEGTGLGLAMVAGIVEDHGGVVKVRSRVNEGSTFSVFLPVLEKGATPEEKREEPGSAAQGSEHILMVEDDESVRTSVQEILKDYGYRVTSFINGAQALEALKEDALVYDLMITDITMPQLTGDKLIGELQTLRPDLPIIVCSGYSQANTMPPWLLKRIRHYFQKPVDINGLLLEIRRILDDTKPGGNTT